MFAIFADKKHLFTLRYLRCLLLNSIFATVDNEVEEERVFTSIQPTLQGVVIPRRQ